ncbi:MAG: pyruvate kinase [Thermoplasmata archaeon]|jgi:pyruvate kinase|nr:pyruvate kinase [Thermoplasmata archaeon]
MRGSRRTADARTVPHLIREIEKMREEVLRLERRQPLRSFGPRKGSARNLVDYLAFRRFDARRIQEELASLGLSSLGRAESHVRGNLESVLRQLNVLAGRPVPPRPSLRVPGPAEGRAEIDRHARDLLGPSRPGRRTRIMVTAPSGVATDPGLVHQLLDAGMDCMRINCAHDAPPVWSAMIANVRRAERGTGRRCRVEMDLCGPRLRTGPMAPGPAVVKVRPVRDPFGRVLSPGRLWLLSEKGVVRIPEDAAPVVGVAGDWLSRRRRGTFVRIADARGKRRSVRVVALRAGARQLSSDRTIYVADGADLRARSRPGAPWDVTHVSVPPSEGVALIHLGDPVLLTARAELGRAEERNDSGRLRSPATFSVLPPEALASLRVGHHVWFDGGRVGAVVLSMGDDEVRLRVAHVDPRGVHLGADKGLNLPDSTLTLPPLTPKDLADLDFVVRHADVVGYSFVQSAADVRFLRRELARRGKPDLAFVLKIETSRGFDLLPEILLAALHAPSAGVMIARGDLAVEVGYERLAEVQEEILWLCEAAHLPAVWATQVLESLTKTGLPSRAEVTDAAMGARAECVMLNKGPHLLEAVRALDNILRRMEAHQAKKSARLRHLHVAERFFEPAAGGLSPG